MFVMADLKWQKLVGISLPTVCLDWWELVRGGQGGGGTRGGLALESAFGWNLVPSLSEVHFSHRTREHPLLKHTMIKLWLVHQNVRCLIYTRELNCEEDQSSSSYWWTLLVFSGKVTFSMVGFCTATGESLDCGNSWKTYTVHYFYSRMFEACPQPTREGGLVGGRV